MVDIMAANEKVETDSWYDPMTRSLKVENYVRRDGKKVMVEKTKAGWRDKKDTEADNGEA
jgi:hypothetical protein